MSVGKHAQNFKAADVCAKQQHAAIGLQFGAVNFAESMHVDVETG